MRPLSTLLLLPLTYEILRKRALAKLTDFDKRGAGPSDNNKGPLYLLSSVLDRSRHPAEQTVIV